MTLTATEAVWADAILAAFATDPSADAGAPSPHPGEVDYTGALESLMTHSNALTRVGVRSAVLLVATAPAWHWRRKGTILDLSLLERQALLRELLEHGSFGIRELALLLKIQCAFALMRSPSLRARTEYDTARVGRTEKRSLSLVQEGVR